MITRPNCGRFLRFRFYLYAPGIPLAGAPAALLYAELARSPLRTDDPFSACVYITIADVHASNVLHETLETTAQKYAKAQLWGSGENHVVFHFGDYGPGFDTGRAVVAASSFGPPLDAAWYAARGGDPTRLPAAITERVGYDVVMPLPFYRCNLPAFSHLSKFASGAAAEAALRAPSARPYILTFKGAAYDFAPGHPAEARLTLRNTLHNDRDIIVALTCWNLSPSCAPCVAPGCTTPPLVNTSTAAFAQCAEWTREANMRWDYDELMLNSRFAAVLPGEGTHSYRLYEALQAGAIPVLLGASARPLEPLINWADIAVIQEDVSPAGLEYLAARLRLLPAESALRMQRRGRTVFTSHFKDLKAQVRARLRASR